MSEEIPIEILLDEENIGKVTEYPIYGRQTQKNQVLFIIYDYPNSSRSEIGKCLLPVTSVTSVTQKNDASKKLGNNSNNGNNGNMVTLLSNSLKVVLNRGVEKKTILVDKSEKPYKYSLSEEGKSIVLSIMREYLIEEDKVLKNQETKLQAKYIQESIQEYLERNKSKILNDYNKGTKYFEINIIEISKISLELANELLENPEEILNQFNSMIRDILNIDSSMNYNIKVKPNLPKNEHANLNNIYSKDLDKLKQMVGEVRARSNSLIKVESAIFKCPSCGNEITMLQIEERYKEPKICGCGRRGKFNVKKQHVTDALNIVMVDLYENIKPEEVLEEKDVFIESDSYDLSSMIEGTKIKIVGIIKKIQKYDRKNTKTIYYEKVIKCVGLERLENNYSNIFIQSQDEAKLKEISKDPITWHTKKLFSDLHNVELPVKMSLLCLYGKMHLLFGGNPGTGKSQIMKRVAKISLRSKFGDVTTSSGPGIIGAVTQNKFTGKYSIDGGILRPMHPGGIVVLDELNRDNNQDIQKKILGVMENRRLILNQANTNIDVPCNVSIWCTVNHSGTYDTYKKEWDNFKLLRPLYDRFNFKVLWNNSFDFADNDLIAKLLNKNIDGVETWYKNLNEEDIVSIRKYQIKSNLIEFVFTKEDAHKLAKLMNLYNSLMKNTQSYRIFNTMKSLLRSISIINLRDHTIDADYQFMTDLLNDLNINQQLFIKDEDE